MNHHLLVPLAAVAVGLVVHLQTEGKSASLGLGLFVAGLAVLILRLT